MTEHDWEAVPHGRKIRRGPPLWRCLRCGIVEPSRRSIPLEAYVTPEELPAGSGIVPCDLAVVRSVMES